LLAKVKSNNPKNLAKVDLLWASLRLRSPSLSGQLRQIVKSIVDMKRLWVVPLTRRAFKKNSQSRALKNFSFVTLPKRLLHNIGNETDPAAECLDMSAIRVPAPHRRPTTGVLIVSLLGFQLQVSRERAGMSAFMIRFDRPGNDDGPGRCYFAGQGL